MKHNTQSFDSLQGHSITESLNKRQLKELERKFRETDTGLGGALELDEFVAALGHVLGPGLPTEELLDLFMRIDSNSDGSVAWDEFLEFVLLENENLAQMHAEHAEYYNPRRPDPHYSVRTECHNDMITQLLVAEQRYFTASYDGTVKV